MREFMKVKLFIFVFFFLSFSQDYIPPDHSNISSVPAIEFVKGMRIGWNLGNTLEAVDSWSNPGSYIPDETAWGNPKATQQLIDSVYAAGFNSIRIPVAWSNFSNSSTYTIKKEWLDRVEEVVNYCLKHNMYVIINEHWDGGWLQPTNSAKTEATKRLQAIWKQVAIRFRNYGDHLIFAGTNEVMKEGDYGTPTSEYIEVQQSYLQTFVNAVRSTGGRNAYRYLVVQTFNTNIDHGVNFFRMPSDSVKDRLIVEVHYYDPWEFTISTGSEHAHITQWGKNGDQKKKANWDSDESHVDAMFAKVKSKFIDKGIPVILGEYGAVLKNTTDNPEFRLAWIKYVTSASVKVGMVPFYWDAGSLQIGGFGLFDRNTGRQGYPEIIKAMMSVAPKTSIIFSQVKCNLTTKEITPIYKSTFSLYTLNGALINKIKIIEGGKRNIDLSKLHKGLYILHKENNSLPVVIP